MGNAVVFAKAFNECGIGGRFSKFQIIQAGEWFELINVAAIEDSRFCFKVYDRLDHKAYRKVEAHEARNLNGDDPQWISHFQTASKVMAKITSKSNNKADTRYYVDDIHKSVFLVNRMFVIEVTPVLREVRDVPSVYAYAWLAKHGNVYEPTEDLTVVTRMGRVVMFYDNNQYNTLLTPDEFNLLVGG